MNAINGAPYSEHYIEGLSGLAHKLMQGTIELVATTRVVGKAAGPGDHDVTETVYRFRPVEKVDSADES